MSLKENPSSWPPGQGDSLPELFRRVGWAGVWAQLIILAADAAFMVYALIIQGASNGVGLRELIVVAGLLLMLITTVIFFRYGRFGERMLLGVREPKYTQVLSTLWLGLWVSVAGIALSLALIFGSVAQLLFILLVAPQQGGAVAIGASNQGFLSALDGVTLMGSLIVLTVELMLVGLTLWLLFKTSQFGLEPEG